MILFAKSVTYAMLSMFPDILGMKRVLRDKKASVYKSAPTNEERPWSRG